MQTSLLTYGGWTRSLKLIISPTRAHHAVAWPNSWANSAESWSPAQCVATSCKASSNWHAGGLCTVMRMLQCCHSVPAAVPRPLGHVGRTEHSGFPSPNPSLTLSTLPTPIPNPTLTWPCPKLVHSSRGGLWGRATAWMTASSSRSSSSSQPQVWEGAGVVVARITRRQTALSSEEIPSLIDSSVAKLLYPDQAFGTTPWHTVLLRSMSVMSVARNLS